MKKMKTVLIVEDDFLLQFGFKGKKPKNVNLLQARTCEQAREIFKKNKGDIDVIAFDGIMRPDDDIISHEPIDSEDITTLKLIKEIKKEFGGIMIAMSSKEDILKQQIEAGCDLKLDEKMKLFEFIAEYEKVK
ncbi:MAG: hypothetical protein Q8K26_03525, partial [Candidatus Gracilibacteria bacterium]|nr:hypothetical protein [Candidatus Gracilibacteria bacterium]